MLDVIPEEDEFLEEVGDKFLGLGMCQEAVIAYTKGGNIKKGIESFINSLKMKTESMVVNESRMNRVKEKYNFLKSKSGSHSPSALLIQKEIPEVKLTIDCCFLSNPLPPMHS